MTKKKLIQLGSRTAKKGFKSERDIERIIEESEAKNFGK